MGIRFAFTDEGKVVYNLGLEHKHQNTLELHQLGYIKKLTEHVELVNFNPKATPLNIDRC